MIFYWNYLPFFLMRTNVLKAIYFFLLSINTQLILVIQYICISNQFKPFLFCII